MAMTKKTISVWTSKTPNPETDVEFSEARAEFMQTMFDAGKTDSLVVTRISDDTFQRNWLDANAANQFVTFFNSLTEQYKFSQTTTVQNI
jgi:hypothetical protein